VCVCLYVLTAARVHAPICMVGSIFLVKRLSLKVPQIEKHIKFSLDGYATAHDVASCAVYEEIKFVLIAGSYIYFVALISYHTLLFKIILPW
jgi:hypothetical protein